MGAAELTFIVKAIDQASGTLGNVNSKLGGLSGSLSKFGGLAGGALVAGIGAAVGSVGLLGKVLYDSAQEAMAAQEVQAQLNAVLESTGGIAGVTADAINEHASELQKMTRYEDDAIVAADAVLLTFTNIGKDIFPKATDATLDLATAFDMDLQSAAIMVGKALNDPVSGLTALGRAGVQFSDDQKETIKNLVEVGDTAAAQALILENLNTQVGGSAEAAGRTFAGQLDIWKNTIGEIKEMVGTDLLDAATDVMTILGPALMEGVEHFTDWWGIEGKMAFGRFVDFLEVNLPKAIKFFKDTWKQTESEIADIKKMFDDINNILARTKKFFDTDIPAAIEYAKAAFTTVKGPIDSVVAWLKNAISTIEEAIRKLREFLGLPAAANAAGASSGGSSGAGGPEPERAYNPIERSVVRSVLSSSANNAPSNAFNVTININAPGGNPRAVALAAQNGMLSAARSMGLA